MAPTHPWELLWRAALIGLACASIGAGYWTLEMLYRWWRGWRDMRSKAWQESLKARWLPLCECPASTKQPVELVQGRGGWCGRCGGDLR